MKIIFISNFLNPHQYPISVELDRLTGGNYTFVETERIPNSFIESGYPEYDNIQWLFRLWEDISKYDILKKDIEDADVVIIGGNNSLEKLVDSRIISGQLTFKYSERWLKRGIKNILSPNILPSVLKHIVRYRNKPYYLLCASAFAASDAYKFLNFRNKAFKWGYFPKVQAVPDESVFFEVFKNSSTFKIMGVCRLIEWKHPEMMIEAANCLKKSNVNFTMDIYGSGDLSEKLNRLIITYDLADNVFLKGNIPNDQIHNEMRLHHCFIFTSNRREGWGAVLNEAMSNGCAVLASDKIGAAPYLIRHLENGRLYKDLDQNDLNTQLFEMATSIAECERLARNARNTMVNEWSPEIAAHRLIELSEHLLKNQSADFSYSDGPCSIAPLL